MGAYSAESRIVVDSAFVLLNVFFAQEALEQRFVAWAEDRRATYEVLLDETLDSMQVLAELLARDRQLHELFVSGRDAVIREGGGPVAGVPRQRRAAGPAAAR